MNAIERDELARLRSEATQGEWTAEVWLANDGGWCAVGPLCDEQDGDGADEDEPGCDAEMQAQKDARLIAAAVNALPQLLADSAELERVKADARIVAEWSDSHGPRFLKEAARRILEAK